MYTRLTLTIPAIILLGLLVVRAVAAVEPPAPVVAGSWTFPSVVKHDEARSVQSVEMNGLPFHLYASSRPIYFA